MCTELQIESTTNQALAAIQASPEVRSFLKIFLAKHYQDLRRAASGGVQPNLNLGLVRQIVLPLPPCNEQNIIVERVESQLSVIEHLEADLDAQLTFAQGLRHAILRHAFSGQLGPQDPSDEPASSLLVRIAARREEDGRKSVARKSAGNQKLKSRAERQPRVAKSLRSGVR
jgi:type I restriction enzyme S subunit